jgi:transposase
MGIDFKCSYRWLQRFREQWNVTWQSVSREGASEEKFQEHVKQIATHYAQKDVFNLDKLALFIMHN